MLVNTGTHCSEDEKEWAEIFSRLLKNYPERKDVGIYIPLSGKFIFYDRDKYQPYANDYANRRVDPLELIDISDALLFTIEPPFAIIAE